MDKGDAKRQFYRLDDNSCFDQHWTKACNVRPHPTDLGIQCDVCGKGRFYPNRYPRLPLSVAVEGGNCYPDALGFASLLLVISGVVLGDWETNHIAGYIAYPVTVEEARGDRIESLIPPRYYHIEVTGRCEIDLEAAGVRVFNHCPRCGYVETEVVEEDPESEDAPFGLFDYIIREETWDGSDLFTCDLFDRVIFCTRRVVDLVHDHHRTNFVFEPLKTSEEVRSRSRKELSR